MLLSAAAPLTMLSSTFEPPERCTREMAVTHITSHIFPITHQSLTVTRHMSQATRHTSRIKRHTSRIKRHKSPITESDGSSKGGGFTLPAAAAALFETEFLSKTTSASLALAAAASATGVSATRSRDERRSSLAKTRWTLAVTLQEEGWESVRWRKRATERGMQPG